MGNDIYINEWPGLTLPFFDWIWLLKEVARIERECDLSGWLRLEAKLKEDGYFVTTTYKSFLNG